MKLSARSLSPWIFALVVGCSGSNGLEPLVSLSFESAPPAGARELPFEAPAEGVSYADGHQGRALRIDGSGSSIEVKGVGELAFGDALTVECFVKPDDWTNPYPAGGGSETVLALSDYFSLAIDRGVAWRLQAYLTTTAQEKSTRLCGGEVEPNVWHHFALDHDGKTGRTRLWLDGVVVDEQTVAGKLHVQNPKLPLRIGTWYQRNQAYCGLIDEVRIWGRVLPDEELASRAPRP